MAVWMLPYWHQSKTLLVVHKHCCYKKLLVLLEVFELQLLNVATGSPAGLAAGLSAAPLPAAGRR